MGIGSYKTTPLCPPPPSSFLIFFFSPVEESSSGGGGRGEGGRFHCLASEGVGIGLYADVLLATDICSPPVGIVTTGSGT